MNEWKNKNKKKIQYDHTHATWAHNVQGDYSFKFKCQEKDKYSEINNTAGIYA